MPRPALHSTDTLLDVTRELVLRDGIRSVKLDRIVAASGAPKGSIYHRFSTVDDLLAAMWIRAVRLSQAEFLDKLRRSDDDPVQAGVQAGLAICEFARRHPKDAQLLAALRREDLVTTVVDTKLVADLTVINASLQTALAELARRLFGTATRGTVEWTTCAVVDLPIGAIRRHLIAGIKIPSSVPAQLAKAIEAALCERGAGLAHTRQGG